MGTAHPDPASSSLIELAARKVRRAIVDCEFGPGIKLKVETLSKEYGLSSSPIREALNRLAQEGVVHAVDNKGFRVPPISMEELRDLSRMRCLLESEALSDSIEHGDDEWEGRVLAAFHLLSISEKRLGTQPVALDQEWSERHKAFHMALFSACTSRLMLDMVTSLYDRTERYRKFSALHRELPRYKVHEHQSIMKAALSRDKEKAVALLCKHIESTRDNIVGWIERELERGELPALSR
jgi:GntR family carbon starvation induced transcriptional regulator